MKKYKNFILITTILSIYLIIGKLFKIYLPCMFHKITNLYCPSCGITRMILSMLQLDFKKAFRYNQLLFILTPFFIFLVINYLYSTSKNITPFYKKIKNKYWIILIIILIVYGVLRNIFPYLAPPK